MVCIELLQLLYQHSFKISFEKIISTLLPLHRVFFKPEHYHSNTLALALEISIRAPLARFNWSRASSKGSKETCNSRFVSRPVAERGIEGCVPTAAGTVVHRNSSNARCNGSLWPYRGECWESWRTFCLWDGNSPLAWEKENVPPPSCCPLGGKGEGVSPFAGYRFICLKLRDPAARQRFPPCIARPLSVRLVKGKHFRVEYGDYG